MTIGSAVIELLAKNNIFNWGKKNPVRKIKISNWENNRDENGSKQAAETHFLLFPALNRQTISVISLLLAFFRRRYFLF